MIHISFEAIDNKETISALKTEWRNSLSFPHDSFDEAQIDNCQHWALKLDEDIIGYACISKKNTLYQYFITSKYLNQGKAILEKFMATRLSLDISKLYSMIVF